jgi:2-polyprenyl-6-methoxyphenol hydroxylase-like FAD-dependent oxidoreductase
MALRETASDVLVIGAGPAGSATAFWLASKGHQVVLLDRCDFPRDKACSEYLGPGAVDLLQRIGVLEDLRQAGHPLTGTTVVGARGSRLTGLFALASAQKPGAMGLSVTRRILDQVLLSHAIGAGVEFQPRCTVEDLHMVNGSVAGVIVRAGDGRHTTLRARLTVGADGLRSIVARKLGGVRLSRPRRMGFVTHVQGVHGVSSTSEMHVSPAGYVGLNSLGPDLTNVALVVQAEAAREAAGRMEEFFLRTLESFPGVRGRVPADGMTRDVMATGPFSARATRIVADGALLVGDAADFFDPFTGEGIYTALRGAELASTIAHSALGRPGPVSARRLAPYRSARRQAFLGKWAVERMIGYGMMAPALFDRAVSRLGRTESMAHTLIGVTADFVPATRVLNPLFLSRMML